MKESLRFNIAYVSEDGRYLGGVNGEKLEKGETTKFTIPDNGGLEHLIKATISSSQQTKDGRYSLLLELDPPAPQRVIDMEWFKKMKEFSVGSIEYEKLKIYSDIVLIIGNRFVKGVHEKDSGKQIRLVGEVISEEKSISGCKYAFTIKLDNKLSEEDYQFLKSIDEEKR